MARLAPDSFLDRLRNARIAPDTHSPGLTWPAEVRPTTPPVETGQAALEELPPGLAEHPDYKVLRELGRGGMGVVYLAHNHMLGRDEVLKVMSRRVVEHPKVLDRFLREIRAIAKLRHPNIVTAYSAFRLDACVILAMEYIDGLDLSRMVKAKGPMPVAHACHFISQAADGLEHANEMGLVHRDIKPGNLMLSRSGAKATVKVLDFGLVKATRDEKVDGGLTSEGQALGTPDFIAPEQILDAQTADIRSDIYSLGGTLFFLLAGHPPFRAKSLYDVYQAHISRDADPLNFIRPEVPSELAALVAKMMAKDPDRRFQAPGEVARALTPFFKKASFASREPRVKASSDGQSFANQPSTEDVTGAAPPSAKPAEVRPQIKGSLGPPTTGSPWESLIDFKESESSIRVAPAAPPARRPP
ncbi:serine/threonine-protein kinase, partial [Singulisphaera rosea]